MKRGTARAAALAELKEISRRLIGMMEDGSFYEFSYARRWLLVREVKQRYDRLRGSVGDGALKQIVAGASVLVLGASCTCGPPDSGSRPTPAAAAPTQPRAWTRAPTRARPAAHSPRASTARSA